MANITTWLAFCVVSVRLLMCNGLFCPPYRKTQVDNSQAQIDDIEILPVYVEFLEPMIDGYRLDWCYTAGEECGEPAATAWCQQQGYTQATNFEIDTNIGARGLEAMIISSGEIVDTDAFKSITCR